MSKTMTILIADDHAIVRKGLKSLLERQGYYKVVAEAETGEEAIAKAQECHPDVAVLDIRMPGLSGIEACREIVKSVQGCKVIMLTAAVDDELLYAAVQAGAAGYVLKRAETNELMYAIERISRGEDTLSFALAATMLQTKHNASDVQQGTEFSALTTRELSVLGLVSKGMTNRQISAELFLGEGTVRNYVSTVLAKLGVANRTEATAFAVKHNLNELVAAY